MQTESRMVYGINTLRGICAIWVLLNHFGPPLTVGIEKTSYLNIAFRGFVHNVFNGPAAVIVFFVISGFCIHIQQSSSLRINSIPQFYLKRLVRIMIPLVVAMVIAVTIGLDGLNPEDSIVWSIICEIIYYLLYPLLLWIRSKFSSWNIIFVAAFVGSLFVAHSNLQAWEYPSFGWKLNWALGLPCWIIGCIVAEFVMIKKEFNTININFIRLFVWIVTFVLSIIRFRSLVGFSIGYPWSLNLFAIIVGYWIVNEIRWCEKYGANSFLEWIGKWSYSIYLVHVIACPLFYIIFPIACNHGMVSWSLMIGFCFVVSYVFYLVVEKPSHWLARALAKRV